MLARSGNPPARRQEGAQCALPESRAKNGLETLPSPGLCWFAAPQPVREFKGDPFQHRLRAAKQLHSRLPWAHTADAAPGPIDWSSGF